MNPSGHQTTTRDALGEFNLYLYLSRCNYHFISIFVSDVEFPKYNLEFVYLWPQVLETMSS